jgi:hypothetical protein
VKVPRCLRLFWAHVRCETYECCRGMWRGECKLVTYDEEGRTTRVASASGSVFDNSLKEMRTFWAEANSER